MSSKKSHRDHLSWIPDHSTIARWRERFEDVDIYEKSFAEVNNQLNNKGLKIKNAMIMDASLIESKSSPRRKVTVMRQPLDNICL